MKKSCEILRSAIILVYILFFIYAMMELLPILDKGIKRNHKIENYIEKNLK